MPIKSTLDMKCSIKLNNLQVNSNKTHLGTSNAYDFSFRAEVNCMSVNMGPFRELLVGK